jgi:hypothetical protein
MKNSSGVLVFSLIAGAILVLEFFYLPWGSLDDKNRTQYAFNESVKLSGQISNAPTSYSVPFVSNEFNAPIVSRRIGNVKTNVNLSNDNKADLAPNYSIQNQKREIGTVSDLSSGGSSSGKLSYRNTSNSEVLPGGAVSGMYSLNLPSDISLKGDNVKSNSKEQNSSIFNANPTASLGGASDGPMMKGLGGPGEDEPLGDAVPFLILLAAIYFYKKKSSLTVL